MRTFGLLLLIAGIAGFFYSGEQISQSSPVPPGLSMSEELHYPAGRFEVVRYVCAAGAFLGILLIIAPKGR